MATDLRLKLPALCALLLAPWMASAEEEKPKAPPPDEEFLEFLGSVDSDDERLNEYIARTDVKSKTQAGTEAKKADDHEQ